MKRAFVLISFIALMCAGCLPDEPGKVPSSFSYKGKPIDPYCFMDGFGTVAVNTVSLDVCSGKTKESPTYRDNNFYGVEFDDMEGGMVRPYAYYKYLGRKGENHVVHVVISTGGTGQFSSVRILSLDGNLLRTVNTVAGGDRCNGGIADASVSDDKISYSQNMTPFDLMDKSQGNQAGFEPYDDIQACAACCVATADFVDDDLKTITLTRDPKEVVSEDLDAKNACFYGTYTEVYNKGNLKLEADKLMVMGQLLNQRCAQLK